MKKFLVVFFVIIMLTTGFVFLPTYKGFELDEKSPNAYEYYECQCVGVKLGFDKCLGFIKECRFSG